MGKFVSTFAKFSEKITYADPDRKDYEMGDDVLFEWCDDCVFTSEDGVVTPIKFIEKEGGGEGGAEYCFTILKIGDKYYKVDYSYHSYSGYDTDYAEVYEVKPVRKMVTVYE